MPRTSVVIPAYARPRELRETLGCLERQTASRRDFEVIVVDDGSPEAVDASGHDVRVLRQENSGPAAARNHGVREATGDIVIFIGDDIQVADDFVERHLAWHDAHPDRLDAALGKVDWLPDHLSTTYMRWLDSSGLQFGYRGLNDGDRLQYFHFYTANLSLKRELLLEHPFDEEFPDAAFEDSELGIRLVEVGMRLWFAPEAVAWHDHKYDLESSCRHRVKVGRAARLFARKQPGYARFRWIRRLPGLARAVVETRGYLRVAEFAAEQGDLRWIGFYYYHRNSEAFWQGFGLE